MLGNHPFRIHLNKANKYIDMSQHHMHDYYEIYYLAKGERKYFVNDRTYLLQQGDIIFINQYDLHKTMDTGIAAHERILIYFQPEFIKPFFTSWDGCDYDPFVHLFQSDKRLLRLNAAQQQFVEAHLQQMMQEYNQREKGSDQMLRAMLAQLLLYTSRMMDMHRDQAMSASHQAYIDPQSDKVSAILQYINDHYASPLTLERLSSEFYLSSYYISRMFRKVTGMSVVQYVNNVRIKEAQRLLRETRMNVTEICYKVGFVNANHFGKVFKAYTGETPTSYRKKTHSIR